MISVIFPSSTATVGPFVLLMSSSIIFQPLVAEYHHDDPSAGPRLSLPVMRLPSRSAHMSLQRPPSSGGYAASKSHWPASGSRTYSPTSIVTTRLPSGVATMPEGSCGAITVCSSPSAFSSQCTAMPSVSTKYRRDRCSSHTRLSPQVSSKSPTLWMSTSASYRPGLAGAAARERRPAPSRARTRTRQRRRAAR